MRRTPYLLAQARRRRGLSQEALARLIPVSVQQVSRWERGLAYPKKPTRERLAEVLEVPLEKLFPANGGKAAA